MKDNGYYEDKEMVNSKTTYDWDNVAALSERVAKIEERVLNSHTGSIDKLERSLESTNRRLMALIILIASNVGINVAGHLDLLKEFLK